MGISRCRQQCHFVEQQICRRLCQLTKLRRVDLMVHSSTVILSMVNFQIEARLVPIEPFRNSISSDKKLGEPGSTMKNQVSEAEEAQDFRRE